MKCLLDRRERAAVGVAEALGWPVTLWGAGGVEIRLPDTWAADLAALMAVFGEAVRRGMVVTGEEEVSQ
jgi:hypothetical protein